MTLRSPKLDFPEKKHNRKKFSFFFIRNLTQLKCSTPIREQLFDMYIFFINERTRKRVKARRLGCDRLVLQFYIKSMTGKKKVNICKMVI